MNQVKRLIEGYKDSCERRQVLQSRLLGRSGKNPLQEESLHYRLEEIERIEGLVLDMIFGSDSLPDRSVLILERRSSGLSLRAIGKTFNLTGQRIDSLLIEAYETLAIEFKEGLRGLQ